MKEVNNVILTPTEMSYILRARHHNDYLKKRKKESDADRSVNEKIEDIFDRMDDGIGYASNLTSGIPYFLNQIQWFVNNILNAIPWLSTVALILNNLLRITISIMTKKESIPTRSFKLITAAGALGVGITSMVIATFGTELLIASVAVDTAHNLWDIGVSIYSYFRGDWKKNRDELKKNKSELNRLLTNHPEATEKIAHLNKKIKKNAKAITEHREEMAESTHIFAMSALSLIGACLLIVVIPPWVSMLGAAILIGVGIYGMADRFNLNPFKWLGKNIFGNPFAEKTSPTQNTPTNKPTPLPQNTKTIIKTLNSTQSHTTSIDIKPVPVDSFINAKQPLSVTSASSSDDEQSEFLSPELAAAQRRLSV